MKSDNRNRRMRKRKDWFSSLITLLLIGTMLFYQLLPFSVAMAQVVTDPVTEVVTVTPPEDEASSQDSFSDLADDASSGSNTSSDENSSDDTNTGGSANDTADPAGTTSNQVEADPAGTLAATEGIAGQTEAAAVSEDSDPCACPAENDNAAENTENNNSENPPCPETCPEVTVENTNDATAENDVAVSADTGNNAIGENSQENDNQSDLAAIEAENASSPEITTEPENNGSPESADQTVSVEPTNPTNQLYGGADYPELNSQEESNSSDIQEDEPPAETPAAVIATGEALAAADVVNEVNVNITTENGAISTQNITGDYEGDVNLLDTFYSLIDTAQDLHSDNQSAFGSLNIVNDNSAVITNNVVVDANTGNNTITTEADGHESDESGAEIQTGDAAAIANVVNLANLNIVGNTWLFAVVNVFGNWAGNLVVPGAGLLTLPGSVCGNGCLGNLTEVSNSNSADIQNNVGANASTGENTINGNGDASIETGDAYAAANVKTIANTNIVANNWFFLIVNNMGSWMGSVLNWNAETGEMNNVYTYDFGTDEDNFDRMAGGPLYVENHNSATIINNVQAAANTGGNSITGTEGEATIQTGEASAASRVVNFINTNIVGNNWMFGLVNIFGSWEGDVEFAYPNLDVSIESNKSAAQPGEMILYTIKLKNEGKAKSDDAELLLSLPEHLSFLSDDSQGSRSGRDINWEFSGLDPDEEKTVQVAVAIDENVPKSLTSLESAAGTKTSTKEPETGNNSASVSTDVNFPKITIFDGDSDSLDSELKIKRQDSPGPVSAGSIISHAITVENPGKYTLHNIEVKDKIKDPDGAKMVEYVWNIAKLKKGQGALIEYQVAVNDAVKPGVYEHTASAEAIDTAGEKVESGKAMAGIEIILAIWDEASEEIVPTATAATEDGPGLVAGSAMLRNLTLPIWIWMLAAAAYYLTVNWSIFPKKRK